MFHKTWDWCSAWTGFLVGQDDDCREVFVPTTKTAQTWKHMRCTTLKYWTPGNRKKLTNISSLWAHAFPGGSQLAGALPGLPLQWVVYSRLTPRLHPAALLLLFLLLLVIHPHQLPKTVTDTRRSTPGTPRHSDVPPGTSSIPTVAIFSYIHVTDLLGLLLESGNFQEIRFSHSLVPYSFPGVFIPAEPLVYCHHFFFCSPYLLKVTASELHSLL